MASVSATLSCMEVAGEGPRAATCDWWATSSATCFKVLDTTGAGPLFSGEAGADYMVVGTRLSTRGASLGVIASTTSVRAALGYQSGECWMKAGQELG